MALTDDWSFTLATAFLDAAVSCGATCDRRFVWPGGEVEGPPPECPCQLAATVTEGWTRLGAAEPCAFYRTAAVKLTLDLCAPAAGKDEIPDAVRWQTAARDAASTRWLMMKGLMTGLRSGSLCASDADGWPVGTGVGCCGNMTTEPWRAVRTEWGSNRWETTWTWRE